MSTTRKTLDQIKSDGGGRTDWHRLDALTDEAIERMAAEDPDSFDIDEAGTVWLRKPDGTRVVIRKHAAE